MIMASSSQSTPTLPTIPRSGAEEEEEEAEEEDEEAEEAEDQEEEYISDEPQLIPTLQENTEKKPTKKLTAASSKSKLPSHFFKSLSTREPSFSGLPFSPARVSSSSCSTTPLRHQYPTSVLNKSNSVHRYISSSTTSHHHGLSCNISSTLNKDRQIISMAVSGPLLYTGSLASTIRIWRLPNFYDLAHLKSNKAAGAVQAIAVSDDYLFAGYDDCKIRVWRRSWDGPATHVRLATIPTIAHYLRNYITGKDQKKMMKKHLGAISSLAINTADDLLYSASVDATVKVWRISKLKCIETIPAHTEPINAIVVGEDGVFYTASDDATVKVWRRHSYGGGRDHPHSLAVTLPTDSSPVKALALTADGMVLYGGCTDGYVHCWLKGWLSGHMHYGGPLQGHRHAVVYLACTSKYMASGSADLSCRVWVRDGEGLHTCLAVLEGHMGPVRCVAAFAADGLDGCMVCTASLDGTLKVWRVTGSGEVSLGPTQGGQPTFQF